jgi:hypothetical protein
MSNVEVFQFIESAGRTLSSIALVLLKHCDQSNILNDDIVDIDRKQHNNAYV